jgi:hypothetical protein
MYRCRHERWDRVEIRLYRVKHGEHSHTGCYSVYPARRLGLSQDRESNIYEFQAAAFRDDPVHRHSVTDVRNPKHDAKFGMLMCNYNVCVVPSTDAPLIWPLNSSHNSNVKFFTFIQDVKECPTILPVSVISRESPLSIDNVHIRNRGQ